MSMQIETKAQGLWVFGPFLVRCSDVSAVEETVAAILFRSRI